MPKTRILQPDEEGVALSASILSFSGLVAIPTETVYGLAGDAKSSKAIQGIYQAKGRPSNNPLILHIAKIEIAKHLVEWGVSAARLAEAFWPGPLTMVLPQTKAARNELAPEISAGLPSIAIRMPAHPIALQLLERFDGPLAAPSANPSGKISPTTSAHVLHGLNGRIEAILDAGPCGIGLESTIILLTDEKAPKILREGAISETRISEVLGKSILNTTEERPNRILAPGQLASHYAPTAPVRLNAITANPGEKLLGFGDIEGDFSLSPSGNMVEAASKLYASLHRMDAEGAEKIAIAPIPESGIGKAINDRLRRAAAPRN